MRILYIPRREQYNWLKNIWVRSRQFGRFSDQDGFFEASLYASGADISTLTFAKLEQNPAMASGFDLVLINLKCHPFTSLEERDKRLVALTDALEVKAALFIGSAQAGFMLPDSVLDKFDIIFKREPFRDRTQYKLSVENQRKIIPTMISCPFVTLPRSDLSGKLVNWFKKPISVCTEKPAFAVGFSGIDAYSHTLRQEVWQRVKEEGFSTIGGLQMNPYKKVPIPPALQGPRFKGKAYRQSLCAAKINLALDGIGEYTFRHQELLALGAFMLSGPSIRQLELPLPLKEGEHYIAFDGLDDMVEKIRYFLAHEEERKRIARAGKELFNTYYDPERQGAEIMKAIVAVVPN